MSRRLPLWRHSAIVGLQEPDTNYFFGWGVLRVETVTDWIVFGSIVTVIVSA